MPPNQKGPADGLASASGLPTSSVPLPSDVVGTRSSPLSGGADGCGASLQAAKPSRSTRNDETALNFGTT